MTCQKSRPKLTGAQRKRIADANLVPVQIGRDTTGFVSAGFAKQIEAQIKACRDDVAAILDAPARAPGRPRKNA